MEAYKKKIITTSTVKFRDKYEETKKWGMFLESEVKRSKLK